MTTDFLFLQLREEGYILLTDLSIQPFTCNQEGVGVLCLSHSITELLTQGPLALSVLTVQTPLTSSLC